MDAEGITMQKLRDLRGRTLIVMSVAGMAIALFTCRAQAGITDSTAGPEASASVQAPELASMPVLSKFSAIGRLTYTVFLNASCPGITCSSGPCNAISFTGPATASPIGKATLAGCVNFDVGSTQVFDNGSGGSCDFNSGNGTLTLNHGNAVTFSLSGTDCQVPGGAALVEINDAYVVTGGSKTLSAAEGQGAFTASLNLVSNLGAGTMTGSYASH
jgi:hypothetical protein